MVTQVKPDSKRERIIKFLDNNNAFRKWTDEDLPDDFSTDDIEIILRHTQPNIKEKWIDDPLSAHPGKGFGKTRAFEGDMKLQIPSNKPIHLKEEIEFLKDGSTKKILYYDKDY